MIRTIAANVLFGLAVLAAWYGKLAVAGILFMWGVLYALSSQ